MSNPDEKRPRQIAILLYPGATALAVVGPWEVLSRMPDTEIRFVGKDVGPIVTEGDALTLGITHSLSETPSPDIVVVPGGVTTPSEMVDDEILDWLRTVHKTTAWTVSVCTGALILGAAGIFERIGGHNSLVQDGRAADYGGETKARGTHWTVRKSSYSGRRLGRHRCSPVAGRRNRRP